MFLRLSGHLDDYLLLSYSVPSLAGKGDRVVLAYKGSDITDRADGVGSVTCRCTRMAWAQFSWPPGWVERGMSGEVWLIFMEESGQGVGGSRKSSLFSCSLVSVSVQLRGSWLSLLPENRPRSRHGTQHSFQDTKRETPKRARPQAVTTRVSRLTEISAKKKKKVS